jgi:hypothetical protein
MFDTRREVHPDENKRAPSLVLQSMYDSDQGHVDDDVLATLLESEAGAKEELAEHAGDVMESASVLTRTRLLGSWVTSPNPRVRLLAAHALQRPFVVLGARSALELLRNDSDPDVQTAARIAAVVRRMSPTG